MGERPRSVFSPTPDLPSGALDEQISIPFDGTHLAPGSLVEAPNPRMPLLDAIVTRRSSRTYADGPVSPETFAWLVGHCMHAPTACNEQQWKIIQIRERAVIDDLVERGSASFLRHARQCFLLCYNRRTDNRHWHDHVQSGAAFITTFQLLAHSVGIGSCWIGHLPNKGELRRLFEIHRAYEPIALVSYGYYRARVKMSPRKHAPEQVIMMDRFDADGLRLAPTRGRRWRTIARWLYYRIPAILRRPLRPFTTRFEKKFYHETFD